MIEEQTLASGMRVWTARPEGNGRRPAVFLLHERYGPVQHSFNLLEKLARENNMVAYMPDLFHRYEGDRGPLERAETRYDPTDDDTLRDLDEALAHLRTLDFVDTDNIGMAGFCQSGRTPLVFAASRRGLKAIAVFHGGVYPRDYDPIYPGQGTVAVYIPNLSCPMFGAFGEDDNLVPLDNVRRLRDELEGNRKSYRIKIFPNVPHGWLNSTMPESYRQKEAEESWQMMVQFFNEVFAGKWNHDRVLWEFESDIAADAAAGKD